MDIFINFVILIVGFAALIKGADWFVDGSSGIAKIFNVPGVIIGLTIVALGTSAPELAVSTSAAINGSNEIALSNVVGSNLFNTLIVLGVCAVIYKLPVDKDIIKRDMPLNLLVTIIMLVLTTIPLWTSNNILNRKMNENVGEVSRIVGLILLAIFIGYLIVLIRHAIKNPVEEKEGEKKPVWLCILLILIGVGLIVGGGEAVVHGAKNIAKAFGMSETLIGLTIVAFGTSLPELVTSVVAATKKQTGMAVGNVIGSNLFNILFILGLSSTIHPIAVNMASVFDMIILTVVAITVYLMSVRKHTISRGKGIILILIYAADMVFAVMR